MECLAFFVAKKNNSREQGACAGNMTFLFWEVELRA